jgi:hypothetical protein
MLPIDSMIRITPNVLRTIEKRIEERKQEEFDEEKRELTLAIRSGSCTCRISNKHHERK